MCSNEATRAYSAQLGSAPVHTMGAHHQQHQEETGVHGVTYANKGRTCKVHTEMTNANLRPPFFLVSYPRLKFF
ncbi:hypothetical protein GJAV_G00069880 [Gymnothorax javanicus]|nr:hypothetical protein GJAV_G00069880 [Gymnothorax javanicus]